MRSNSRSLLTIAALIIVSSAMWGWSEQPTVHPAQVLRPTIFGVTPPVSEFSTPAAAEGVENYEIPNHLERELPALPGAQAPDQVMGEGFISPDSGALAPSPTFLNSARALVKSSLLL